MKVGIGERDHIPVIGADLGIEGGLVPETGGNINDDHVNWDSTLSFVYKSLFILIFNS